MKINMLFTVAIATVFTAHSEIKCSDQNLPSVENISEFVQGVNDTTLCINGSVHKVPFWFYLKETQNCLSNTQSCLSNELSIDNSNAEIILRWRSANIGKIFKPEYRTMFMSLINNRYTVELIPITPRNPMYSGDRTPLLNRPVTFKWKITEPQN